MLDHETCLTFLEGAVKSPSSTMPLRDWVMDNLDSLENIFDRRDFLALKHRGLLGARQILERCGRIEALKNDNFPIEISETHCRKCGDELFWALPGRTTRTEIVAFANLVGNEEVKADQWIHPGVYCPRGCTKMMFNSPRLPADIEAADGDSTNG